MGVIRIWDIASLRCFSLSLQDIYISFVRTLVFLDFHLVADQTTSSARSSDRCLLSSSSSTAWPDAIYRSDRDASRDYGSGGHWMPLSTILDIDARWGRSSAPHSLVIGRECRRNRLWIRTLAFFNLRGFRLATKNSREFFRRSRRCSRSNINLIRGCEHGHAHAVTGKE